MSSARPALPPPLRVPLGITAVFAALVVVALGVRYAGQDEGGRFDQRVDPALEGSVSAVRPLALVIDFAGEPVGAAVLLVMLVGTCLLLGRRRMAVLAVLGPWLTVSATTLTKFAVDRTINGGHLAYPSGHTASATALTFVVALLLVDRLRSDRPKGMVLILGMVGLAGAVAAWAQAGLNAHYPTDTLGGFCTALAIVPATAWVIDRVADREARKIPPS